MTCLVKAIFHVPCPTCGVTRALLSLLRFDFASYAKYNIFALPLFAATVLMIFGSKTNKKIPQIAAAAILLANIPYYFFRLTNGTIL